MSLGKQLSKCKLDLYEVERAEYYKTYISVIEKEVREHIAAGRKSPVTVYIKQYTPLGWFVATLPPKKESVKLWKKWAKDNSLNLKVSTYGYEVTIKSRKWWQFW